MRLISQLLSIPTLTVSGPDRVTWLNGLLSCDVALSSQKRSVWGLLLSKQGKIQAEVAVVATDDQLLLGVLGGDAESVRSTLDQYLVMEDAEIQHHEGACTWGLLFPSLTDGARIGDARTDGGVIQLPDLLRHLEDVIWAGEAYWIADAGRGASAALRSDAEQAQEGPVQESPVQESPVQQGSVQEDSTQPVPASAAVPAQVNTSVLFVVRRPEDDVARQLQAWAPPISRLQWDALRVKVGLPRYGQDFSELDNPHEAGLERRAVSWKKGCYLGQEVVCMQDMRGRVKRRVVRLDFDDEHAQSAADDLVAGSSLPILSADGTEVGRVTTLSIDGAIGSVKSPFLELGTRLQVAQRTAVVSLLGACGTT